MGRLKREVFSTPVLNHIVVEPLLAALCDPLVATRLMTVHQMERVGHATDGATTSLRVPSVRISLQPIITASYARCLHILPLFAHILSTLSVSVAVTRPLTDTALETANSLPGLCISLTLFAHILNVVCTQSSSPLSAHQSPSTLPLAASRSQPVPLSLFPERFLPAS